MSRGQLDWDDQQVKIDQDRLNTDYGTLIDSQNKLYYDIFMYVLTITQFQIDLLLYQFKNLGNLQGYLNKLNSEMSDYAIQFNENPDSLPQRAEANKKLILDTYKYIHLYAYCTNIGVANTIKNKMVSITQKLNN
jgi:hypothetical protein